MTDSRRAVRDRIEDALLAHYEQAPQTRREFASPHDRRVLAGMLRKVYCAELDRLAEAEATLARVRAACRRHRDVGDMPVVEVLDALYGEDVR